MIRKNLTLYILSMLMLLTSSGLAADWVDMGRVDFIVHLSDKDYEATKNDVKWYFDADSVTCHDDRSVTATVKKKSNILNRTEYRLVKLECGQNASDSAVKVLTQKQYDDKTGTLLYYQKYPLTDGNYSSMTTNIYGIYYDLTIMYRELGYFMNMPNENGAPYITPKSMGLTWINSTSKVGVFYYPDTVKVKKNNIDATVVFWYPKQNRIQTVKCTLDYNKKLFKPKSSEMRRINTGDLIESVSKGLIPGLGGPRFINHRFDEDDESRILADYFKDKVNQ